GHAGGPAADDDDVGVHLWAIDVLERSSKNQHEIKSFEFQVSSFERADLLLATPLFTRSDSIRPFKSRLTSKVFDSRLEHSAVSKYLKINRNRDLSFEFEQRSSRM